MIVMFAVGSVCSIVCVFAAICLFNFSSFSSSAPSSRVVLCFLVLHFNVCFHFCFSHGFLPVFKFVLLFLLLSFPLFDIGVSVLHFCCCLFDPVLFSVREPFKRFHAHRNRAIVFAVCFKVVLPFFQLCLELCDVFRRLPMSRWFSRVLGVVPVFLLQAVLPSLMASLSRYTPLFYLVLVSVDLCMSV